MTFAVARGRQWRTRAVVAAAFFVLLSSLAGCVPRPPSSAPHQWQVRGAVVAVQDSTLRVRHKSGRVVVLLLDERTTYEWNNRRAPTGLLKVGARVMVDVLRAGGVDRALRVQVFGVPGATPLHADGTAISSKLAITR
jgi:Domain of unknown function (DUF5666)